MPQQFEAQKIQYPDELPEIERSAGHEQVHGIADPPFEVVSHHPVITLEMADDWLDGGPAAKAFSGFALLAAYLAGIWIDYTDGRDDDRLTERLSDDLERELYGAPEGADRLK